MLQSNVVPLISSNLHHSLGWSRIIYVMRVVVKILLFFHFWTKYFNFSNSVCTNSKQNNRELKFFVDQWSLNRSKTAAVDLLCLVAFLVLAFLLRCNFVEHFQWVAYHENHGTADFVESFRRRQKGKTAWKSSFRKWARTIEE